MRILADARTIPLQSGTVQCVVTSPPYWGLRDYGTARWEGGEANCPHTTTRRNHNGEKQATSGGTSRDSLAGLTICRGCGAQRIDSQIGLESTPDAYVAALVGVMREVWWVLRDDGTLWLNLGDSYAGSWGAQSREHTGKHAPNISALSANQVKAAQIRASNTGSLSRTPGLKPKDLVGIPWRVAFALQADGWYLRSDIIWAKPNPMPESVTDRPTKAHEYVFLLTKRERYYYDAEAIREKVGVVTRRAASFRDGGVYTAGRSFDNDGDKAKGTHGDGLNGDGRNCRSVWSLATHPYAEAHFATMPEKLAERCILAGSKPGDLVLDPFGGSGTTVKVARSLNRRGVMLDLNPAYLDLAKQRNANLQPSLLETEASA